MKRQNDEVEFPDTKNGPLPPDAKSILQFMLVKDPSKRPSFEDIKVCMIELEYALGSLSRFCQPPLLTGPVNTLRSAPAVCC